VNMVFFQRSGVWYLSRCWRWHQRWPWLENNQEGWQPDFRTPPTQPTSSCQITLGAGLLCIRRALYVTFSWPTWFLMRNTLPFEFFSLLVRCHFSSVDFKIFLPLWLWFSKVYYRTWYGFLWVYLIWGSLCFLNP
jgi:hypothetical protein